MLLALPFTQTDSPPEIYGAPTKSISIQPGGAEKVSLSRGQYRIRARMRFEEPPGQGDTEPQYIKPGWFRLNPSIEGEGAKELKRIYVHKFDLMPPDAENLQEVTAIIRIVDNPIWIPALLLGLGAVAGGVLSYSVIDGVDTYAEEGRDLINSIALISGALGIAWYLFK